MEIFIIAKFYWIHLIKKKQSRKQIIKVHYNKHCLRDMFKVLEEIMEFQNISLHGL